MKRRYSIWRISFGGAQSKAMRRLGKSPEDGRLELADVVMCCALLVPLCGDSLFDKVVYGKSLMLIATSLVVLVGMVLKFRRLSPRTCWGRASWATILLAMLWSLLPWLLHYVGDMDISVELATQMSISSLFMWVVAIGCMLRYRYIRRRSQQEIAMMRMREKRRRREQYL